MEFNEQLKSFRKNKGMSLRELAEKSFLSHSYISRLESGSSKNPNKDKILSISYALEPSNSGNLYQTLLDSASYSTEGASQEFKKYAKRQEESIDIDDNRMMFDVVNNKTKVLDYPFFDLEWLLNQENFLVFIGYEEDKLFILNNFEKEQLKSKIEDFKQENIRKRDEIFKEKDRLQMERDSKEYNLMMKLLQNNISNDEELTERLFDISDNKTNLMSKEYINELYNAARNNDAINLQKLINMDSLDKLKNYLNK